MLKTEQVDQLLFCSVIYDLSANIGNNCGFVCSELERKQNVARGDQRHTEKHRDQIENQFKDRDFRPCLRPTP